MTELNFTFDFLKRKKQTFFKVKKNNTLKNLSAKHFTMYAVLVFHSIHIKNRSKPNLLYEVDLYCIRIPNPLLWLIGPDHPKSGVSYFNIFFCRIKYNNINNTRYTKKNRSNTLKPLVYLCEHFVFRFDTA